MNSRCWGKPVVKLLNLLSPGDGRGVIFVRGKFKFELFLSGLWYEPNTLWLFLTFTRASFAGKKFKKILNFQGVTYFFSGDIVKK